MGLNPLFQSEKLGVGSSFQIVNCCSGVEIYGESLFQSFLPVLMWVFSHSPESSGFLSEITAPCVLHIGCVCPRKRSGVCYVTMSQTPDAFILRRKKTNQE